MIPATIIRRLIPALAAVMLILTTACSDDDASDATDNGAVPSPSTTHTLVMTDNKFNVKQMAVPTNQEVTVTVRNEGSAIHNWHVLKAAGADGKEISTALLRKDESETVTFTLTAPGAYDFRCDTHPVEMKGKLTVQ